MTAGKFGLMWFKFIGSHGPEETKSYFLEICSTLNNSLEN